MYVYTHTQIHTHYINKNENFLNLTFNIYSHFLTALNITKAIVRQRTLTTIKVIVRQENMLFLSSTHLLYPRKIVNSS